MKLSTFLGAALIAAQATTAFAGPIATGTPITTAMAIPVAHNLTVVGGYNATSTDVLRPTPTKLNAIPTKIRDTLPAWTDDPPNMYLEGRDDGTECWYRHFTVRKHTDRYYLYNLEWMHGLEDAIRSYSSATGYFSYNPEGGVYVFFAVITTDHLTDAVEDVGGPSNLAHCKWRKMGTKREVELPGRFEEVEEEDELPAAPRAS